MTESQLQLSKSIKNHSDRMRGDVSVARNYHHIKSVVRHILENGPGLFKTGMATLFKDPKTQGLGFSFLKIKKLGKYQEKKIQKLISMYK